LRESSLTSHFGLAVDSIEDAVARLADATDLERRADRACGMTPESIQRKAIDSWKSFDSGGSVLYLIAKYWRFS